MKAVQADAKGITVNWTQTAKCIKEQKVMRGSSAHTQWLWGVRATEVD